MKLITFTLSILFLLSTAAYGNNDKIMHAGASLGLTAGSYMLCRSVFDGNKTTCRVAAALGTLAVGAAKEVADGSRNTNKEHMKDMGANAVGVGLGLMFTLPF